MSELHPKWEPRLQPGRLYSMMDLLGPTMICDHCGSWERLRALTETEAYKLATEAGWTCMVGRDLCPNCAPSEVAPQALCETEQSSRDGREQALKARAAQPNTILKAPK